MFHLLELLGIYPRGGNYETVRKRIKALGLDASHLRSRRSHWSYSEEDLSEAVRSSASIAETMRRLGLRPEGGGRRSLKRRIHELELDVSHFKGQGWSRGRRLPHRHVPVEPLLVAGRFTPTHSLKMRLIRAGMKEARCEVCGRESWEGRPIPLELDHINGRRDDNRIENLRLMCPNCHAQTPTYRGRNIGRIESVS